MICEIPAVVTDNAAIYTATSNAITAAGESLASSVIAKAGEISATNSAISASASKVAAHDNLVACIAAKNYAHKWATKAGSHIEDGENDPGYSAYYWAMQAKHYYDLMAAL
jgi:hypothetical protein